VASADVEGQVVRQHGLDDGPLDQRHDWRVSRAGMHERHFRTLAVSNGSDARVDRLAGFGDHEEDGTASRSRTNRHQSGGRSLQECRPGDSPTGARRQGDLQPQLTSAVHGGEATEVSALTVGRRTFLDYPLSG
jgi:hypothetical protein